MGSRCSHRTRSCQSGRRSTCERPVLAGFRRRLPRSLCPSSPASALTSGRRPTRTTRLVAAQVPHPCSLDGARALADPFPVLATPASPSTAGGPAPCAPRAARRPRVSSGLCSATRGRRLWPSRPHVVQCAHAAHRCRSAGTRPSSPRSRTTATTTSTSALTRPSGRSWRCFPAPTCESPRQTWGSEHRPPPRPLAARTTPRSLLQLAVPPRSAHHLGSAPVPHSELHTPPRLRARATLAHLERGLHTYWLGCTPCRLCDRVGRPVANGRHHEIARSREGAQTLLVAQLCASNGSRGRAERAVERAVERSRRTYAAPAHE